MNNKFDNAIINFNIEVIELSNEIAKARQHGLNFKRDRSHTSLQRICQELNDLQAIIDHMKMSHGIDFDEMTDSKRYKRKLSILRMEDALTDMDAIYSVHDRRCGLPVHPEEFKGIVDFWMDLESFYKNYPISLIHDTKDTINCINVNSIADRERMVGKLSIREHAICDYFHKLFKEDKRPEYYIEEGFNLSAFVIPGKDGKGNKYNNDYLWMALAMLIQRGSYLEQNQKDNEKKFIENGLNYILGILVDTHEYTHEYENVVKDNLDKGVEDCRKIGIKMNDGLYIDFFNNGIGTVIEVGETELTCFTSDIYV